MPDSILKWRNASKDNPGFTVWYATPTRDENVLYIIRRKRKPTRTLKTPAIGTELSQANIWRVFMRPRPGEPARTIYVAPRLDGEDGAKQFVRSWEEIIRASLEIEPVPTV